MTKARSAEQGLGADPVYDTRAMVVYATRYALGRSSYAPGDVMRAIRAADLDATDLRVIARDIREQVERDPDIAYAQEWRETFEWVESRYAELKRAARGGAQ